MINSGNLRKQYSLDLFHTNLFVKIFTSFNYSYQKYLKAKKNNNDIIYNNNGNPNNNSNNSDSKSNNQIIYIIIILMKFFILSSKILKILIQ